MCFNLFTCIKYLVTHFNESLLYIIEYYRLYATCSWEDRAIRKLVGNGKLAPRQKGLEDRSNITNEECPICFLYYNKINITGCCKAHICSECYLQVRPQKIPNQATNAAEDIGACPFCNTPKFTIKIASLTNEAALRREEEEKKAIEAYKHAEKARCESSCSVATVSSNGDAISMVKEGTDGNETEEEKQQDDEVTPSTPDFTPLVTKVVDSEHFGASLDRDLARRRTHSNLSDSSSNLLGSPKPSEKNQHCISTEDRQKLEDEMKKQMYHPLTRQAIVETASSPTSQRVRNGRGMIGGLRRRFRPIPSSGQIRYRDLGDIIGAVERERGLQAFDDIVVLEAAILLSMEEQARIDSDEQANNEQSSESSNSIRTNAFNSLLGRHRLNNMDESRSRQLERHRGINLLESRGMYMRGLSEDDQMEMAIAMSLRDMEGGNGEQDNLVGPSGNETVEDRNEEEPTVAEAGIGRGNGDDDNSARNISTSLDETGQKFT